MWQQPKPRKIKSTRVVGIHTFGNLKFMLVANRIPSGQLVCVGEPITAQILNISSVSLVPGKRGLNVNSSAIIAPTAHMSIGELYVVLRSKTSGALYL